jgi:signal transduction histidine kinase
MYNRARTRLTIVYSLLFILFFWLLSFGVYFWFDGSLGQGYITQVKNQHQQTAQEGSFDIVHGQVVTIAGHIAERQLRNILLLLNLGLLFFVPISSWYLTNRTLDPIDRAYEHQKQFISDASHELRTPLSILSGEIELALKKPRTILDYQKIMLSSKEEIERMTELVSNLLFLARIDFEGSKMVVQDVDVTDLLVSVLNTYRIKFESKKLIVNFSPAAQSQTITGSQSMLQTLFSNLIDNAIKYTPENGKISISIKSSGKFVTINIKDSGIGINSKDMKKIFDRFYRSDKSRSNTKGYGLGLSISRSIVDMHKGTISVNSVAGNGTEFSISLPKSPVNNTA